MYSVLMIPMGVLPYLVKCVQGADGQLHPMSGAVSMWIVLGCNLWMVYTSIVLYIKMDVGSARKVMFSSYFYLMIVLLSLFADKN
jgi:protoheme IX farnesyltransferase